MEVAGRAGCGEGLATIPRLGLNGGGDRRRRRRRRLGFMGTRTRPRKRRLPVVRHKRTVGDGRCGGWTSTSPRGGGREKCALCLRPHHLSIFVRRLKARALRCDGEEV